jgi:hypothetical protein
MEPKPIYFDKESPEYNLGLYGKHERLAANRVVLCVLTEFGLVNDARMQAHQVNAVIESSQATTGSFKEHRTKVKLKSSYIKQRHSTEPIRATTPATLSEHTSGDTPIDSISQ